MTLPPRTEPYFAPPQECRECPYSNPCVGDIPPSQKTHRISRATVVDCIYRGLVPSGSIRDNLDSLQHQVRAAASARYGSGAGTALSGGLRNARGEWLENILGMTFWNAAAEASNGHTAIVKLPNANQISFHQLFETRSREYLEELFRSLEDDDISMEMSNPDFLCVTDLSGDVARYFSNRLTMSTHAIDRLNNAYQQVIGQCHATTIPFVLTVKTSIRPDRRYQIVHEANVVKTLMAHLSGRFWNKDLYSAFYAMVAGRVSSSDRQVLRNPATYSLVQVSWQPVALVDDVFEIESIEQVQDIIQSLLR